MNRPGGIAFLCGVFLAAIVQSARGDLAGMERIASGLSDPVFVTQAPGNANQVFIVEKTGAIEIWDIQSKSFVGTFLTIDDTEAGFNESGLLGLAFHPDYNVSGAPGEGKFYVNVTVDNGTSFFATHIREYSVSEDPEVANTTPTDVMTWPQPASNHNAGWLGFNPRAAGAERTCLYINTGDGGGGGDPNNHAQTIVNERLGKILRVDVDGTAQGHYSIPSTNPFVGETGDDEIWSYGLRNPWRASFDRKTGDFWIGDVGQSSREEIDFEAFGTAGGANYGWNLKEGNEDYEPMGTLPDDYVPPVYDYGRIGSEEADTFEGNAVTGGNVYRGPDVDLQGLYFFADYISGRVWTFDPDDPTGTRQYVGGSLTPDVGSLGNPASFGEDAWGNLYLIDIGGTNSGEVFRILTDNDAVPGDYDRNGIVEEADYELWKEDYGSTTRLDADGNGDGRVGAADYTIWQDNLGASSFGSGSGSGFVGVPEPATFWLAAFLTAALLRRRDWTTSGR